jgi:putative spermidine/putrescine transport system permease protein
MTATAQEAIALRTRPGERRPRRSLASLMMLPACLLLTVAFAFPYAYMIYVSFLTHTAARTIVHLFTLKNYSEILGDPYNWAVFGRTFAAAVIVTLASLALAYPIAYHLARTRGRWQSLFLLIVLSPLLVGVVIRSYGWMILLANTGLVNSILRQAGVVAHPLPLMYNLFGVSVGLIHIFMPFMILTITGALQTIDPDLEHMARSLGADPRATFATIVWPLSLPGVYAGTVLVFVQAMSAYATPTLLGGFRVITAPILVVQTTIESFNWPMAAAMGLVLFVASLIAIGLYSRMVAARLRVLA